MSADTDSLPGVGPATGDAPNRTRVLLISVGVLALLLIGAAGGLVIARSGPASPATPAADSVDVGFLQDMSVHHEQAVQMASWERDHTTDPVLRGIAFDIEATQTGQIGTMQGWLELWGASAFPIGGHMAWMSQSGGHQHGGGTGPATTMPGMATTEELRTLRAAGGGELDVLFLQLTLRHHEGGGAMLAYAAEHAAVPQVRNLAEKMASSQSAESEYLRQLLTERGGTPLPM